MVEFRSHSGIDLAVRNRPRDHVMLEQRSNQLYRVAIGWEKYLTTFIHAINSLPVSA